METPDLSASKIVNRRRSSAFFSRSSTGRPLASARLSVSSLISAPRTAFISAISNDGAMAMTSPVAFICVPSARLAPANLSNGHFGSLTTT